MPDRFDVVVVGTGSAATQIAYTCQAAGKSVAMIDSKPFGGTCALRGCDPKKVLVGAADLVDWAQRMHSHGVAGDTRIDWPALMRFKRRFTEPVPAQREAALAKRGIEAIHGRARFTAPDGITVGERKITAHRIAIATGMRPVTLGIPGENKLINSEQFLDLDELPPRIVFIGGGYIAFEFGHLAARAGAKVTILDRGPRALKGFDPALTARLVEKTRACGIEVILNAAVTRIAEDGLYAGDQRHQADLYVHAAGRVPDLDDLQLSEGGVEYGPRGVRVNEYLQSTSNPSVYAAGDCADTGNPPLTPVAGYEGGIAAANINAPRARKLEPQFIPTVVFSIPPMAQVGLSEEQANNKRLRYQTITEDSSHWYSSRRIAEDCSGSKVLIEEGSKRILGVHLLGTGAEEIVNIFALAMRTRLTADDLKNMIFAYPTKASDIPYMVVTGE